MDCVHGEKVRLSLLKRGGPDGILSVFDDGWSRFVMMQPMLGNRVTLVLGGARSGKSIFAEDLVKKSGLAPIYIATSEIYDAEMQARVDTHRARRGPEWTTVHAPDLLEKTIEDYAVPGNGIIVDCMTLWLTNLMMAEAHIEVRCDALVKVLSCVKTPVVLVSNEVGLGIVPDNKMARDFRDHAGRLHQQIAAVSKQVYFVAAGLPLTMKG